LRSKDKAKKCSMVNQAGNILPDMRAGG